MVYTFDTELAKKYGVDEAIMLQNFIHWIAKNRANGKHEHDGRTWTYNTAKAFSELFPFWTERQVNRIIDSLVEKGVLLVGNYNQSGYDRTRWYAFSEESILLDGNFHFTKPSNGNDETVTPIPDIKPYNKPDINTYSQDTNTSTNNTIPNEANTLANLLFTLHKEGDSKYKVHPGTIDKWAMDIDKLHRLDERSWDEIEKVIRWCKNDAFWRPNIMSGAKLRYQFPRLFGMLPKQSAPPPQQESRPVVTQSQMNSRLTEYYQRQAYLRDHGQPYDSEIFSLIENAKDDTVTDEAARRLWETGDWHSHRDT